MEIVVQVTDVLAVNTLLFSIFLAVFAFLIIKAGVVTPSILG